MIGACHAKAMLTGRKKVKQPATDRTTKRPRRLFRIAAVVAACLGVPAIGAAIWILDHHPEMLIERPAPGYAQAASRIYLVERDGGMRREQEVLMTAPGKPGMRFAVSLPRFVASDERLPVLVILAGMRTARQSLDQMPQHGRNAIVSLEYPLDLEEWGEAGLFGRIRMAREGALETPDQVAALLRWAADQPWADPRRTTVVGVSLGAVLLPVSQRRAERLDAPAAALVLAHGAADVATVLISLGGDTAERFSPLAAPILRRLISPLEPANHLPKMTAPTLLITADEDDRMPAENTRLLEALAPDPKTVLRFEGAHVRLRRPDIVEELVETTRNWLHEGGYLNR